MSPQCQQWFQITYQLDIKCPLFEAILLYPWNQIPKNLAYHTMIFHVTLIHDMRHSCSFSPWYQSLTLF